MKKQITLNIPATANRFNTIIQSQDLYNEYRRHMATWQDIKGPILTIEQNEQATNWSLDQVEKAILENSFSSCCWAKIINQSQDGHGICTDCGENCTAVLEAE